MHLGKRELKDSSGLVYVSVFFDTVIDATVDVWTGSFGTNENFRAGLLLVLENIQTFQARKWLADLTRMEGDFALDKEFIANTVIPRAISLGLQKEAVVLPDNVFSLLSVQETMQIIENFEIRIFGSVEDAARWLNEKRTIFTGL